MKTKGKKQNKRKYQSPKRNKSFKKKWKRCKITNPISDNEVTPVHTNRHHKRKMEHKPKQPQTESTKNSEWYHNPHFNHFWKCYDLSKRWYRQHIQSVQKAENPYSYKCSRHSEHDAKRIFPETSHCSNSTPRRFDKNWTNLQPEVETDFGNRLIIENDSESSESDNESYEMIITEEMMKFFQISEKHKKERKANLAAESKKFEDEYVALDSMWELQRKTRSEEPPEVQPGANRASEMKELYGTRAPMIHAMETAIQLSFDKYCDSRKPKLWPNIPLKL